MNHIFIDWYYPIIYLSIICILTPLIIYYAYTVFRSRFISFRYDRYVMATIQLSLLLIMFFLLYIASKNVLINGYITDFALRLLALATEIILIDFVLISNSLGTIFFGKIASKVRFLSFILTIAYIPFMLLPYDILKNYFNQINAMFLAILMIIFLKMNSSIIINVFKKSDRIEDPERRFVTLFFTIAITLLSLSMMFFTINRFLGLLFGPLALASSILFAISLVFLIFAMAPPEFILRRWQEF